MSNITKISEWILRQPLVWGGVACLAFYACLNQGWIDSPLIQRYFNNHPVLKITTALFCVGMAALAMRGMNLAGQFASLGRVMIDPIPLGGQGIEESDQLLEQLEELPDSMQSSYLVRRLWNVISFIRRKDSADSLDSHLRHLEELDLAQMHAGYGMVRIIIWAVPILGFLGTVIGITVAIANLSPDALERSLPEVTTGLGVAFDTTALALGLSMVLMFTKFCVERLEDKLLISVDVRTSQELVGRFKSSGVSNDPNVVTIRLMSEQVLTAVEALAARQAHVWKSAIDETHQQWAEVSVAAGKIVKDSLGATLKDSLEQHANRLNEGVLQHADRLSASAGQHADKLDYRAQETVGRLREGLERLAELLVESLHRHGEVMTASERELAEENRRHLSEVEAALGEAMVVAADRQEQLIKQSENLLKEMQIALVEAAGATVRQQEQLIRQGDVLLQVVDATGQVKELETTLNQNLAALRQASSFEELAVSLAAAIQLLSVRLGPFPSTIRAVEIGGDKSANQAA